MNQQLVDSMVAELSPLVNEKQIPLNPLVKREKTWYYVKVKPKTKDGKDDKTEPKFKRAKRPPKVLPTIEQSEVKRRTGFASSVEMIAYIITACNGDFNRIR